MEEHSERSLHSRSLESRVSGSLGLDFLLNTELGFGFVPSADIGEYLEEIKFYKDIAEDTVLHYSIQRLGKIFHLDLYRLLSFRPLYCGYD